MGNSTETLEERIKPFFDSDEFRIRLSILGALGIQLHNVIGEMTKSFEQAEFSVFSGDSSVLDKEIKMHYEFIEDLERRIKKHFDDCRR